MKNGISIYLGLDNTLEDNLKLLEDAAQQNIRRVFTSLHIPETNTKKLKEQLTLLLSAAQRHSMDVISDISPNTYELLGLNTLSIDDFAKLGIGTLRLDFGFSLEEIAQMSHNKYGVKLQFNASTITKEQLSQLKKLGTAMDHIDALHNFYPRKYTGLDEEFFVNKNCLLQEYGLKVSAFIPSFHKPRGPLHDGLPTLELHRETSFDFALRHMSAMGVDSIFIGDSLPSPQELHDLGTMSDNRVICLKPEITTKSPLSMSMLTKKFSAREDEARDLLRTQESREYFKEMGSSISPENCIAPKKGAIIIDNHLYARYEGELQITKRALPADERVNVLGYLSPTEQQLLKFITPGKAFRFVQRI